MYCCCQKCLLYVTTVCCVSVSCLLLLQAYIITSYIPTLNKALLALSFGFLSGLERRGIQDHKGSLTCPHQSDVVPPLWRHDSSVDVVPPSYGESITQQSAVDRLRCWFDRDLDVG